MKGKMNWKAYLAGVLTVILVVALAIPVLGDQTAAGRALRDGGGIGQAVEAGKSEIAQAAKNAVEGWKTYLTETLPNAVNMTDTVARQGINAVVDGVMGAVNETTSEVFSWATGGGLMSFIKNLPLAGNLLGYNSALANYGFVSEVNSEELQKNLAKKLNGTQVEVEPKADTDFANEIVQQVGPVTLPVQLQVVPGAGLGYGGGGSGGRYGMQILDYMVEKYGVGHANGIWSVPWDGYPAILHKGERVLTARESQNYTYNNYFGNVNLNNGLEIEALTESLERRNARQRSGYGA